ncbi:MAG: GntR family transcriptional regulator [Bacillota bacterium]|nr:GntR family transcriptional regulator [Bacillota bacterium]
MTGSFDADRPIYQQLAHRFRERIVTGYWQPGERMASVRELALEYGVNPNTVQRALAELEREGLAIAERTSGRFITEDEQLLRTTKRQLAEEATREWAGRLRALGLDQAEGARLATAVWTDGHGQTKENNA